MNGLVVVEQFSTLLVQIPSETLIINDFYGTAADASGGTVAGRL